VAVAVGVGFLSLIGCLRLSIGGIAHAARCIDTLEIHRQRR
jgi:hypothetical protein